MQDTNYTISNNQAKQIANCIYLDIANYIEENKTEYLQWIQKNNLKGENNNE